MLISNGSLGSTNFILAPDVPRIKEHAVEAQIQLAQPQSSATQDHFGIFVRGIPNPQGTFGYAANKYNSFTAIELAQGQSSKILKQVTYSAGTGLHTYRIEVHGVKISLLIDGSEIGQVTNTLYINSGYIGLIDVASQIQVHSFKLFLL